MLSIAFVLFSFITLGILLASGALSGLPIRAGYIGAVILVVIAFLARRHWRKRARVAGDDPSTAERRAWLYMAGTAMICAYVIVVLATPGTEVHRVNGGTGGFDSWIMLAGASIAWGLLYERAAVKDERDRAIDGHAIRVGYTAIVVLLIVFLLALGFAPRPTMQRFTHWLIANSLLTVIMLSALAHYVAQLVYYQRDRLELLAASKC